MLFVLSAENFQLCLQSVKEVRHIFRIILLLSFITPSPKNKALRYLTAIINPYSEKMLKVLTPKDNILKKDSQVRK